MRFHSPANMNECAMIAACGSTRSAESPANVASHSRVLPHAAIISAILMLTITAWARSSTNDAIEISTPQPLPVSSAQVNDWVDRAAKALTAFYGRYPVRHVHLIILPAEGGGGVQNGREWDGRRIEIHLGADTTEKDLRGDWMLTHEMFHLSQPDLGEDYSWMSEGMADYLEPVARVRIGQITPEKFWKDLVEGLPQGLPQSGDQGLDRTHTWGRTYWGGCLYWLLADVRVHEQTHNKKSVRDAAKAALDAGGDGSQEWTIEKLLDAYDRGTGTTVFKDLHDEMGNKPAMTDLDALWKSLGIIYENGQIKFDDHASRADVRKSITSS
jgi:hypothetical protein